MSVPRWLRPALVFIYVLFLIEIGITQPILDFQNTIGGDDYEEQNALIQLSDGYLLGGNSRSSAGSGEVQSSMYGNYDFWIVRTDLALNPIWDKAFGGNGEDWLRAMIPTSDGGFLAAGYSNSGISGVKSQANRGDYDFWVVKFDADGNLIWEKTFGGTGDDECYALLESKDNSGYFLGGFSNSNISPDKSKNGFGDLDFWLIKIDNQGNRLWDRTIGGPGREQFHNMIWTSDNQIALVGGTSSQPEKNDVGSDPMRGGVDFWLVKFDPEMQNISWNHRFGGASEDFAYTLVERKFTNGFLLGGTSKSPGVVGGNCTNCKKSQFYGDRDFWVVETDFDGKMLREWSFGGSGLDVCYQIVETAFGQIYLGGVSDSPKSGNKSADFYGDYDFWTVFLDQTGQMTWQKAYGGEKADALTKIYQNRDGSYLLLGHSQSEKDSVKTEDSRGKNDFWILKTFCDLTIDINNDPIEQCGGVPAELRGAVDSCSTCLYRWSSGENTSDLTILPPANQIYTIETEDWRGCFATDSMHVQIGVPPIFDLGRDTVIYTGETLQIGVENQNAQYLWNTGDTTQLITVAQTGLYFLTVTDPSGCTARDYARIYVQDYKAVYIPNIFTPNFDGTSDYFYPFTDKATVEILFLRVFDRWGTEVFECKNTPPNEQTLGWDGNYRNRRVSPDTYFYVVEIKYDDGETELFKGSINVER
jgi:gliding motility-associated-like protein